MLVITSPLSSSLLSPAAVVVAVGSMVGCGRKGTLATVGVGCVVGLELVLVVGVLVDVG